MKYTLAVLLLCFLIFSCKKDGKQKIDVSQITETDAVGNNIGPADNTDWTFDASWTKEETSLFQAPTSSQLAGAEKAAIVFTVAYPNPFGNILGIVSQTTKVTLEEIVITDDMLNVKDRLFFTTTAGNNSLQIAFDAARYNDKTNYRLYYAYYSQADGMYYKGHGDVRISR